MTDKSDRYFIAGLDLETTGLDFAQGDRIIEVCMRVYRWPDRELVATVNERINPEGQKIHPKAQKVHGISAVDLIGKPTFKEVAPKIEAVLKRTVAIVAHNGEAFDVPFLMTEFLNAGIRPPTQWRQFDTMLNGMFASYDGKPPSLRELCYAMGVEYDPSKAHAAVCDVDVMMAAFFKGVDRGLFDLEGAINQLRKVPA